MSLLRRRWTQSPRPAGAAWQTGLCLVLLLAIPGAAVARGHADAHGGAPIRGWLDRTVDRADARHLLARTGFGHRSADVAALIGLDRREAIDRIVGAVDLDASDAMPTWSTRVPARRWQRVDLPIEEQRRFDRQRDRELASLRRWWTDRMLDTASPQSERLVLFWHDHFATRHEALGRFPMAMARQHETFRRYGFADFGALLGAMLRDPALLEFLNATDSGKTDPNENFGRELLELFTLGEGHYLERDVKAVSRVLTGLGYSDSHDLAFRLRSWDHDFEAKTLFGQKGHFDVDALVLRILERPATARHLARRFWHEFVSDTPANDEEIGPIATRFRASGHSIPALYRAVLESEAFWSARHRFGLVKSPVDLVIGSARSAGLESLVRARAVDDLAELGQALFSPPDVAGWPGGDAWITPARLIARESWLARLRQTVRDRANDERASATRTLDGSRSGENAVPLVLDVAAESFDVSPRLSVELVADGRSLWRASAPPLPYWRDRRRQGRIAHRSDLAWQTLALAAPPALADRADELRVHFDNDAAEGEVDRNVYVHGARLGELWLPADRGRQVSACPPDSAAAAGDLYCAGYVALVPTGGEARQPGSPSASREWNAASDANIADRPTDMSDTADSPEAIEYGSAHVRWVSVPGRSEDGRSADEASMLILALTDLVLPDGRHFDTYTFRLVAPTIVPTGAPGRARPDVHAIELQVETFDCWPGCLQAWPACSRVDPAFEPRRTLSIGWHARDEAEREDTGRCELDALAEDDRTLLRALRRHALALLDRASSKPSATDASDALGAWRAVLVALAARQAPTTANPFDADYAHALESGATGSVTDANRADDTETDRRGSPATQGQIDEWSMRHRPESSIFARPCCDDLLVDRLARETAAAARVPSAIESDRWLEPAFQLR